MPTNRPTRAASTPQASTSRAAPKRSAKDWTPAPCNDCGSALAFKSENATQAEFVCTKKSCGLLHIVNASRYASAKKG